MPTIETLVTFTVISILLGLSPGPSNLYVMARSISQGLEGGVIAALGLATGSLFHVAAAVLGLSAIFTAAPLLYTLVKLSGAAYLVYLGIKYWLQHDPVKAQPANPGQKPMKKLYRESIIVEITNPKTAIFFIALLPQFVDPAVGPISSQLFVLGLIITLTGFACDMIVAMFSSQAARWLASHEGAQRIQEKISGTLLLGLGSYIAIEEAVSLNH